MDVEDFHSAAVRFADMPYAQPPYCGRAWGNAMHSLCSYQGKLKPAIAHFLIEMFTSRGESVLDPFSGAGTIPLEASLQGRVAHANDLQELAYILSTAKVGAIDEVRLQYLLDEFAAYCLSAVPTADELAEAHSFGLNGKVSDYFHEQNLCEVLNARRFIHDHLRSLDTSQALVFASFLHILHGNRPYALSRTSHPVTPLKPRGPFEYRELRSRLEAKVRRALGGVQGELSLGPDSLAVGSSMWGDFRSLSFDEEIDAVITSPPFADSTRFYSSNWMRLWAAGWSPQDFRTRKKGFLEEQQRVDMGVYREFFGAAARWLRPEGRLIMHLGKTKRTDMSCELQVFAREHFEVVYAFDESVVGAESFGISDQGATKAHQFLFLKKA